MAAKKKPVATGFWRYVGNGTRIIGIPKRDLTPSESDLFGHAIEQVNATGTVLYVWEDGMPPAPPVVVVEVEPAPVAATVASPVYEVTLTEVILDEERAVWRPGGEEHKDDE